MADRRMFAKSITSSGRFLRLPPSARLLYYDLGMDADDDGVVEAFSVLQRTTASEDDLRLLEEKGFIIIINDDMVSYITDWRSNNLIRGDRYKKGPYRDVIEKIESGKQVDNQVTTNCQPNDNQVTTNNKPDGCKLTPQVRLGKVSIGKDRLGKGEDYSNLNTLEQPPQENASEPASDIKNPYGKYQNVLLTDEEIGKLKAEFPDWQDKIEHLSEYMVIRHKSYNDHYGTITHWGWEDQRREMAKARANNGNVFLQIAEQEGLA